jgi:arylsulfatase A-like enzyme
MDASAGYVPPSKALDINFDGCTFSVIRDEHYKYVHFADLPPLLFDLKKDPDELHNLASHSSYRERVSAYMQKMLSWRMINAERTLTHMIVKPNGVVEEPPNYR